MTGPARWDRTIYRGTDHAWRLRRVLKATGDPIVPTSANSEIRLTAIADELWVAPDITIDAVTGWITLAIPAAATEGPEWDDRQAGVWDIEVIIDGQKRRWAQGKVTIDHGVTQ